MKTIKMPKELGNKWLRALRSGEYKQCQGRLSKDEGFCCLGVLESVVDGRVEDEGLPSMDWLREHKVEFLTMSGVPSRVPDVIPREKSFWDNIANINDSGKSFSDIADIIEANMECAD